jgi:hypothetical protein
MGELNSTPWVISYGVDLIFLLNPPQIKKSQLKDGKLNFVFQIKFYINKKDTYNTHYDTKKSWKFFLIELTAIFLC